MKVLLWMFLLGYGMQLASGITCEHCKDEKAATDDCSQKDQLQCAATINSCIITYAELDNGTMYYIDKKCGHKSDKTEDECSPQMLEMDNGETYNSTMCICHSNLCNNVGFTTLKENSKAGSGGQRIGASILTWLFVSCSIYVLA